MTITAFHFLTQLVFCSFHTLFLQEFHSFSLFQSSDRVLLHVRWRILARSLRPGAAGEQDAAGATITIQHIEPFAYTWAIGKSMPCLPVQEVFELIEDYQARFISSLQSIEE